MDGKTRDRRIYTWQEACSHNTATDCWIVIDKKVYDVSKWLKYHPGGVLPLLYSAGQDCSSVFKAFHPSSWIAEKRLPQFYIGDINELDTELVKESEITCELDKIHEEIVKEGGYETYCKLNIFYAAIKYIYEMKIICMFSSCYVFYYSSSSECE